MSCNSAPQCVRAAELRESPESLLPGQHVFKVLRAIWVSELEGFRSRTTHAALYHCYIFRSTLCDLAPCYMKTGERVIGMQGSDAAKKREKIVGTMIRTVVRSPALVQNIGYLEAKCPRGRWWLQLHRGALRVRVADCCDGTRASSISPDGKGDKQKIKNHKGRHVRFAADAKSITVETFAHQKVHALPPHKHGEKTNDTRNCQAELGPPTSQPTVQRQYVTKQRD